MSRNRKDVKDIKITTRQQVKGGTWSFMFHYYDEDFERRTAQQGGFKTQEEAYTAGIAARKALDKTQDGKAAKYTLSEFVESIWIPYMEDQVSASTMQGYIKLLKPMLEKFGKYTLYNIKYPALRKYFHHRYLHTSESINSTDHAQTLLGQVFKAAVCLGYLEDSPMEAYKRPNFNRTPPTVEKNGQVRDVVSQEVLDKIYDRFPEGTLAHLLVKTAELTGMRKNEIFGLAFEDIDFENRVIYLSRQILVLDRDAELFPYEKEIIEAHPELAGIRYVARNPKCDSKRVVPIPEELYTLLVKKKEEQELNALLFGSDYINYWYTRQYAPQFENRTYESFSRRNGRNGGYDPKRIEQGIINSCGVGYPLHFVFVRENGELLRPDYTTDMSAIIHGENGNEVISKSFNLHSLRNNFTSRKREEGMREHLISAITGHKNKETTEGYMRVSAAEFYNSTHHIRCGNSYCGNVNFDPANFDIQQYLLTLDRKGLKALFDQVSDALYGE